MTLHVDAFGPENGPVVALLHGVPSPPHELVPLARAIAETGRRALVVHASGYGQSPRATSVGTAATRAQLVETFRAHRAESLALVGFSGGAYRALDLACHGGLAITGVCCLAGMATLSDEGRRGMEQFAAGLDAGVDFHAIAAPRFLSPTWAAKPAAAAQITAWLDATSPENLARELRAFAVCPDLLPDLPQLECPILARTGTLDLATPEDNARAIIARAQRGRLELVEGVGHALLIEDEPATVASVLRFLVEV